MEEEIKKLSMAEINEFVRKQGLVAPIRPVAEIQINGIERKAEIKVKYKGEVLEESLDLAEFNIDKAQQIIYELHKKIKEKGDK